VSLPDRDVLLCRDCCCGTERKHPATDHRAPRAALEALDDRAGRRGVRVRVRVVDCLSECERSNVVVVRDFTARPGAAGRRPVTTWLGDLLDVPATEAVVRWVRSGGTLPEVLRPHVFEGKR
jgi:hypothetical protein